MFLCPDDKCVAHCKEGFFVDEESRECEPCHRACRTCGGPQYNDCDSCEDGFTLENGDCLEPTRLAACPEKHFRNSTRNVHFTPVRNVVKYLLTVSLLALVKCDADFLQLSSHMKSTAVNICYWSIQWKCFFLSFIRHSMRHPLVYFSSSSSLISSTSFIFCPGFSLLFSIR